jgi:hypothetical protein
VTRNGIVLYDDKLTPGLKAFPGKLNNALGEVAEFFTPQVEGYAKTHAPWTDRTGNARNGLHATSFHEIHGHGIDIAHSVPYGIWLEIRHEGHLAIIIPTIKTMGKSFMGVVRKVFSVMH